MSTLWANTIGGTAKATERLIQRLLYRDCLRKGQTLVVPNCCCYLWEADLLSLSKKRLVTEYEIKLSRSDFRADLKKPKHADDILMRGSRSVADWRIYGARCVDGRYPCERPNYFAYVMPVGLVPVEDVPAYCGLYLFRIGEIERNRYPITLWCERRPRRLHREAATEELVFRMSRSIAYKFWDRIEGEE